MTETAEIRRCQECGDPLPSTVTAARKFCSRQCNYRSWYRRTQRVEPPVQLVRLHWHELTMKGYKVAGYWRGEGCPEECPGAEPGTWTTGIPVGNEGLLPRQPTAKVVAIRR